MKPAAAKFLIFDLTISNDRPSLETSKSKIDKEINILKPAIETVNNNIQHLNGEFIRLENSLI